jgi:predicted Fe-Mo cluster-binding NifX family protein
MRVAVTVFGSTVSPLFDAAQQLLVADLEHGEICNQRRVSIGSHSPTDRLFMLASRGVQVLICGAISSLLQRMLSEHGIRVYPWVSGEVDQILDVLSARFKARTDSAGSDRPLRVAVTANGPLIDADVAPSLKGCSHVIILTPGHADAGFEAIALDPLQRGRECIGLARRLIDSGVDVMITGRCGPNARGVLSATGVQVVTGARGHVGDAAARYAQNEGGHPCQHDRPESCGGHGAGSVVR